MATPSARLRQALSAARNGSRESLGWLLQEFRSYLLVIANAELEDDLQAKAGASDLVQQTFLEAQQSLGQFKGSTDAELLGWLRRILLNNLANFRRDYKRLAKRTVKRETPLSSSEDSADLLSVLMNNDASPSSVLVRKEQEEMLNRLLNRLPENYRQAIVLRQREECSFNEIGARLNCSAEAARKLWVRGLKLLQKELAHEPGSL